MKSITLSQFGKRYNVLQRIGSGSFGQVFRIEDWQTKESRALKKIKLKKNQNLSQFLRQIQIQNFLAHPLVLKIFEFYIFQAQNPYLGKRLEIGIVMELGHRSLLELIKDKNQHFPVEEIINFTFHFIKLFAYFQDQNIVHRDIKPQNFIQFGQGLQCKLIDFGLCSHVNDIRAIAGSFYYFSPKLKKLHYNPKLNITSNPYKDDVYSFGLTLYELITKKVGQAAPRWGNSQYSRDIFHETKNNQLTDIIEMMLQDDEDKRPDFIELFEMMNQKFTFYEEKLQEERVEFKQNERILTERPLQYSKKQESQMMQKNQQLQGFNEQRRTYKPQLVYQNGEYEFRTIKECDDGNFNGQGDNSQYVQFTEPKEEGQQNQQYQCQEGIREKGERQNQWWNMKENILDNDNNLTTNYTRQHLKLEEVKLPQCPLTLKPQVSEYQVTVNQNGQQHSQKPTNNIDQLNPDNLSYARKNYHLGPKISITAIIVIKEFVICGCKDGLLYIINTDRPEFNNIYRVQGMLNFHTSPITAMGSDYWGRLWTASADSMLLVWDRPKFFHHLTNINYYHQQVEQRTGKNGQKYTRAHNFIQMHPDASFPIKLPFEHPSGISSLYCVDDLNFVVGYNDGFVFTVWKNVEIHYAAHTQPVTAIKLHQNQLLTSSLDGTIRILQLQNIQLKQVYFKSDLPIRNFSVTGSKDNPNFTIISADGRGYAANGWTLYLPEEEQKNFQQQDITSAIFANDLIFTISDKGVLYRNGQLLQQCNGEGWTCLHWNNESMMVMGSLQGELVVINSG